MVPVVLSPFLVESDRDDGYQATNSISGTRLNEAIRDIPLSIEVVTREFMRDTAALDLREALRYSAGVVLESQNDGLSSDVVLNNSDRTTTWDLTEGHTKASSRSTFKIRGFLTQQALRDGFRRQYRNGCG